MVVISTSMNGDAIAPSEPSQTFTPGRLLEIKRIDKARVPTTGEWKIFDSSDAVDKNTDEQYAKYAQYAFVVRRKVEQRRGEDSPVITTMLLIQSDVLQRALKDVMKYVTGLSWNVQPFKVDPYLLLAFLPSIREYLKDMASKDTPGVDLMAEHLAFLINFLESEYRTTIRRIECLLSHNEITFELLWAILLPHSIIFSSCNVTSEPRAFQLQKATRRVDQYCVPYWRLFCEYVDAYENGPIQKQQFGMAKMTLDIPFFHGVKTIGELSAYPIEYHLDADGVRAKLIARGRTWIHWNGVHHAHYNGMAYRSNGEEYAKVKVNGRVMIDRRTFAAAEPNYRLGGPTSLMDEMLDGVPISRMYATLNRELVSSMDAELDGDPVSPMDAKLEGDEYKPALQLHALGDDALLLASPIVYGFSLLEKRWLEFNVEHVRQIEWNDEVFRNLSMDRKRKTVIQSLVETHAPGMPMDDFVQGKGLGLVINLFGPPGVGKSLTVEAISEHLRKPLYVVGAGDLGENAHTLDQALTKIFNLAPVWNAVVLIDEADVFLEKRGASDLQRNAMVAVFLRQLEYFRGILFLTTNRVKAFDPAFQSRIHLSLRYDTLTCAAKEEIWKAFLDKAQRTQCMVEAISSDEIQQLSEKDMNGRQIKNAVKLAVALANHENVALSFGHLLRTMEVIEDFDLQGGHDV